MITNVATSGSTTVVSSGVTSSGLTISSGDSLIVQDGGTARRTTVDTGGKETVEAGGLDINATLLGGNQEVAGSAAGTILKDNASQTVDSGGVATGATVGVVVENGGGFTLTYGEQIVSFGGLAARTTVEVGQQTVAAGGTASRTTVEDFGAQDVYGRSVDTVLSGGSQNVFGQASNTVVGYDPSEDIGGELLVFSGGSIRGVTVETGGVARVLSGASASGLHVSSGGELTISALATVSGATISSGGALELWNDATVTGLVKQSGAIVIHDYEAFSGETLSGVVVASGAYAQADPGGTLLHAVVKSGGGVNNSGGAVSALVLSAGAFEELISGVDTGDTLVGTAPAMSQDVDALGFQLVDGGVATGTRVRNGGWQDVGAGEADSSTVASGGLLEVDDGGLARQPTIRSGGDLLVYSGAVVSNALLNVGATIDFGDVSATSTTSAAVVGHKLVVYSGGAAVESIGVRGPTSGLQFVGQDDGTGGTAFLVTSGAEAMTSAMAVFAPRPAAAGASFAHEVQSAHLTLGPQSTLSGIRRAPA